MPPVKTPRASTKRRVRAQKRDTGAFWPALGAALVSSGTMAALDLGWLGGIARGFYDRSLKGLKRDPVNAPAAGLFYAFYATALCGYAVYGAKDPLDAVKRGAGLGLVAYGTYELTNWSVIKNWPAKLVPVDIAWGVALTSASAYAGKRTLDALKQRRASQLSAG